MSSRQQSTVHRTGSELSSDDVSDRHAAATFDTSSNCVECGGHSFTRTDAGEWYCDECGAVHTATELEFTEPGWTDRQDRRTGPASSPSRISVGTKIGNENSTAASYWAQYNKRLSHDQETLRHGLRELRSVANALETAESLTEQAAYLFRRVATDGLLVGHSLEAMAAACVHVIAREQHVPFPQDQVAEVSPVSSDDIKSAVSKLIREYDLRIVPPLPTAYIARFASEAGLSTTVRRRAEQIAEAAIEDEAHVGQSPTGVAAAALYGAAKICDEDITQDDLASVAYVSVVTLSRQWQRIEEYVD